MKDKVSGQEPRLWGLYDYIEGDNPHGHPYPRGVPRLLGRPNNIPRDGKVSEAENQ